MSKRLQRNWKPFVLVTLLGITSVSAFGLVNPADSGYSITPNLGTPDRSREVSSLKTVKRENFNIQELSSKFASWGISPAQNQASINLLPAWKNFKGAQREVVVAVIDTGIDPTHPFLKNNIYDPNKAKVSGSFGVDFSKGKMGKYKPMDHHGHGTHVAGIIKSVFPQVKILALKYYDQNASGQDNLSSTIKALRYAVDSNVDIINYSGGGPEPAREELEILKEAERKGILVIAAAGNEESNIDKINNAYYPASYGLKNIVTVTAHDKKLTPLPSSNYGKKSVDLSAPGHRIKSALPNGRAGYLTGTSQATAFASGVAAMLKAQYPNLSAFEIKEILKSSAKRELSLLSKCSSGGRLDASQALELASKLRKNTRGIAEINKPRNTQGRIFYRKAN